MRLNYFSDKNYSYCQILSLIDGYDANNVKMRYDYDRFIDGVSAMRLNYFSDKNNSYCQILSLIYDYEAIQIETLRHGALNMTMIIICCQAKCRFSHKTKKVKVSHSLITVGAVGVRIPLYLGHS